MKPTYDYLKQAECRIRETLMDLRPVLLEAQGSVEHQLKADKTVVTDMDVRVEERLRTELADLDPSVCFSGEETGGDYNHKTFWLVDPIDSTEAFIRGLPFCTNMLALIDNNEPVMSVVYNFMLDEFYVAVKGHGTTCNSHVVRVSDRSLDRAYVSLYGSIGSDMPGVSDRLRAKVRGMTKSHASGCDYAWVSRGALDGVMLWNGSVNRAKLWDHAAGPLLIAEAGGRVANIGSDSYDFRNTNLIAANPVIFDELAAFVQASMTVES